MITIKFRKWAKHTNGEMGMVDNSILMGGNLIQLLDCDEGEAVMQFTGLLDKNGKEIYEGDIVSEDNLVYEIKFINGCFVLSRLPEKGFWLDIRSTIDSMVDGDIHYDTLSRYEVIGNIWEHADLLNH